jgi:chromosome partitioning protein
MNDRGIDLDVLVNVHPTETPQQLPLSQYATMVWDQRMQKAARCGGSLEWLLVRNRMHALFSRNQAEIHRILSSLSKRIGFHLAGGMTERVIFRELFGYGLTVLDGTSKDPSHVAARREVLTLTDTILQFFKDKVGLKLA